ncbi:hypothetical protein EVAR_88166_1 [Eumeta japonica]|uniref:Uncharacterized protein n=1 Tax=Eumeta variegata TaxID=151549 RepID=A0A4C1WF06_EUMVA|nr:hypothetical protein EVAR_88166_1 [Eumeta japonica]
MSRGKVTSNLPLNISPLSKFSAGVSNDNFKDEIIQFNDANHSLAQVRAARWLMIVRQTKISQSADLRAPTQPRTGGEGDKRIRIRNRGSLKIKIWIKTLSTRGRSRGQNPICNKTHPSKFSGVGLSLVFIGETRALQRPRGVWWDKELPLNNIII